MHKTTSIEVKCECTIPFRQELVSCLQKLLVGAVSEHQLTQEVPHRESICNAVQSKLLFIKINLEEPAKRWRKRLLDAVHAILGKNLVGIINGADNMVTLVVL